MLFFDKPFTVTKEVPSEHNSSTNQPDESEALLGTSDEPITVKNTRQYEKHGRIWPRSYNKGRTKKFVCQYCNISFYKERDKVGHVNNVHLMVRPFKCSVCDKAYARKYDLVVHMRNHTGEKLHGCQHCEKQFTSQTDKTCHERRVHTGEKPYSCSKCDKHFYTSSDKNQHDAKKHSKTPRVCYPCLYCGKLFSMKLSLKDHENIHTGEKPYKCKSCDEIFASSATLRNHTIKYHKSIERYKRFVCTYCGDNFTSVQSLCHHERTHTGERPFKCSICDKTFIRDQTLKEHQRIHTKEKPYKCFYCDRTFSYPTAKRRHERIHTGVKPYKCKHCVKTFTNLTTQVAHERIHTGERPYKCKICSMAFKQHYHVKRHMITIHKVDPGTTVSKNQPDSKNSSDSVEFYFYEPPLDLAVT